MDRYRLAILGLICAMLVVSLSDLGASARTSDTAHAAQWVDPPTILFSGLLLPEGARYSVGLLPPAGRGVSNLRTDVALPAESEVLQASETPQRTIFLGSDGNVLAWAAPRYAAGEPIDSVSFLLAQPLSGEARIRVTWNGDQGRESAEIVSRPALLGPATATEGIVVLGVAESDAYTPVGDTGVQISVRPDSVSEGTALRVTRPGPDANPPAGVGSPWWCAALVLDGLPTGKAADVLVPARQPLPPGIPVDLFARRDGGWEQLEQKGRATLDGQFVAFSHPGGLVAAGIRPPFQPFLRGLVTPTPTTNILLNPPIFMPTEIRGGPVVAVAFTSTPTRTPTPRPPPTATPAPRARLNVRFISGDFVVRSFEDYMGLAWEIELTNTGTADASNVIMDVRGVNSPVDLNGLDVESHECRILQGIAILGTTRVQCTWQSITTSQRETVWIFGSTTVVIGDGNRTLTVEARDNFPGTANSTTSDTFTYAVNP